MKLLKLYKTSGSRNLINVPYIGKGRYTLATYLTLGCELDISTVGMESLNKMIEIGYKEQVLVGWKP